MTDSERTTLTAVKGQIVAAVAALDKLPDVTSKREKEAVKALRAMLVNVAADVAGLLVVVPPTPPPPIPPLILSFWPAKSPIVFGETVRLNWTAKDATAFTLLGNGMSVDLTDATWFDVAPLATTIYTLTAFGPGGHGQAMTVVSVLPVPVPEPPPVPVPTPIPPVPVPTPLPQEFRWLGKIAERVGPGYGMLSSDGDSDGTFLYQPGKAGTITELRITSALNDWCTGGHNTNRWVLGVSVSGKDGPLVNLAPNGTINQVVDDSTQLHLFCSDAGTSFAKIGEQYDLSIAWAEGDGQNMLCFGGGSPSPTPQPPIPPGPLPPSPPAPPPSTIGELLGPGGDRFLSWATNQPDSVTVTPGTSVDWTGEQVGGRTVLIEGDVTVGPPD